MLSAMLSDDDCIDSVVEDQYFVFVEGAEGHMVETEASLMIYDLCEMAKFVAGVLSKKKVAAVDSLGRHRLTSFGKQFLVCLKIDYAKLSLVYKGSKFNPYVTIFGRVLHELKASGLLSVLSSYPESYSMSDVVSAFELASKTILSDDVGKSLKVSLRNAERNARKNVVALELFLDSLFDRYSRILVIRLDLRYSQPTLDPGKVSVDSALAKQHFNKLLKFIKKSRYGKGLCGYICKLEYGACQQFHYHFMVLLNGALFREDVSISRVLGEEWLSITEGQGCYFNCNARKEKYVTPALGMVQWNDVDKLSNLKVAAGYLAKSDLLIRANLVEGERALRKSGMPKAKSPQGRHRA